MVFFWKKPVEKCTRYFPRGNVNRGKVTPAAPYIIRFLIAGSSFKGGTHKLRKITKIVETY
jgi:hypothetical protein